MRKFTSVCCVVLMVLLTVGCGKVEKEITNIAVFEDCHLELKEATTYTSDEGQNMIRVSAIYTNNSTEPLYAACCFSVRAFQNDIQLADCSNINGNEAALIQEIKDGQSLEVYYVFELPEESEVEILIGTPTADQETIGKQTYFSTAE